MSNSPATEPPSKSPDEGPESWRELIKPAADRLALIGYLPDTYITLEQPQAAALATMLRSMAKLLDTYEGRQGLTTKCTAV